MIEPKSGSLSTPPRLSVDELLDRLISLNRYGCVGPEGDYDAGMEPGAGDYVDGAEVNDIVDLLRLALQSENERIVDAEAKRWGDRLNWIHLRYEVDGSGTESGDPLDVIEAEIKQALAREGAEQVTAFANAVLHGDDKHKAWLREAAQCFIDGRPLPEKKS